MFQREAHLFARKEWAILATRAANWHKRCILFYPLPEIFETGRIFFHLDSEQCSYFWISLSVVLWPWLASGWVYSLRRPIYCSFCPGTVIFPICMCSNSSNQEFSAPRSPRRISGLICFVFGWLDCLTFCWFAIFLSLFIHCTDSFVSWSNSWIAIWTIQYYCPFEGRFYATMVFIGEGALSTCIM